MNALEQYKIDLVSLKNQDYTFTFTVNHHFFQTMQTDLVEKGALTAKVSLRKSDLMIALEFQIDGSLELICDRSLEPFEYPVSLQERLILQFGDREETLDDELEIIPYQAQSISLAQYLYEYIAMAVPMKKLHPKFADEEDDDAEVKLIYSSSTDQSDSQQENTQADPRWEALKKLNKN